MSTGSCSAECQLIDELEVAMRSRASWYEAAKLHDRNEHCWGVVGVPYGALAEDDNGGLFMRLTEVEARGIAHAMSSSLAEAA